MKCEICGQEATHRLSPDLDIDGLGGCDKHREDVQIAYYILLNEGFEACQSFLKSVQKSEAPDSEKPNQP